MQKQNTVFRKVGGFYYFAKFFGFCTNIILVSGGRWKKTDFRTVSELGEDIESKGRRGE